MPIDREPVPPEYVEQVRRYYERLGQRQGGRQWRRDCQARDGAGRGRDERSSHAGLGAHALARLHRCATALTLALLAWGYWRTGTNLRPGLRFASAGLKAVGLIVLALCLLEPMFSGTRARPGANLFVVLVDNSQSMALKDRGAEVSRGEQAKALSAKGAAWPARLGQDFDVRQHAFDAQLRALPDFAALAFDGGASNLAAALRSVARRYQGRPLAGVLLFSDGSATDAQWVDEIAAGGSTRPADGSDTRRAERIPPVYPVHLGTDTPAADLSVESVTVTQTNFEESPVTLAAQVVASGYAGRTVTASLLDEAGKVLERQKLRVEADGKPAAVRFSAKPEQGGVSFYRVTAAAEDEAFPQASGAVKERPPRRRWRTTPAWPPSTEAAARTACFT